MEQAQRAQRPDPSGAGVKAVVQDGGPALVDGLPSESKAHWLDDCEQEAFGNCYSTENDCRYSTLTRTAGRTYGPAIADQVPLSAAVGMSRAARIAG
ncbi:MAG: hypothetical protein ABW000_23565 [Actinoplanes sp.]